MLSIPELGLRAFCRQYCTGKLHRLRKSLKLQNGRGKFQKKSLDLANISSSRVSSCQLLQSQLLSNFTPNASTSHLFLCCRSHLPAAADQR